MATYRKYGINPLLISVATGMPLADIPESPPPSWLPGQYASKIYKQLDVIESIQPESIHMLTCNSCGRNGQYNLGRIAFNGEKFRSGSLLSSDNPKGYGFGYLINVSGYFRCRHCNAAGPWEYPANTRIEIQMAVSASLMLKGSGDNRIFYGEIVNSEGIVFPWGTDMEEHYLTQLKANPVNGFLWNRLGNSYNSGGRPDLAVVAYELSIKHDLGQTESYFSLGRILLDAGLKQPGLASLRQVLLTSGAYDKLAPEPLRDMLSETLIMAHETFYSPDHFLEFLPKFSELPGQAPEGYSPNPADIRLKSFSFHPGSLEGMYPLAEVFMGMQRKKLPGQAQVIFKPDSSNRVVHPNKKKPPKKKGKKR